MDIKELRNEIDLIDDQMLELFQKRMETSSAIAAYKRENNLPILNRTREREVLAMAEEKLPGMETYANRFMANLMELSRAYQAHLNEKPTKLIQSIQDSCLPVEVVFPKGGTVAVSGVEGAYAQEAADRIFPRGNIQFMKNFEAVFEAVTKGEVDFGVVPVENSSYGSVKEVYTYLRRYDVSIVRSVKKNIQHELLAKRGTRISEIKEIYSHEQAIGQCSKFIKSLGEDVVVREVVNTAVAAQMVADSDRTDVACIASHDAGSLYGLTNLRSTIMDSANNYTRFIVIQKDPAIYPGANRISMILATEHRPGALYDILAQLSSNSINLIKLESSPMVGHDFEFFFYVDMEANIYEPGVLETLAYLERTCASFKYLGNYSVI